MIDTEAWIWTTQTLIARALLLCQLSECHKQIKTVAINQISKKKLNIFSALTVS
jgi:hypothetical protein